MNTKTLRELRSIAKDKGLRYFYKLKKDDLLALLLEQSSEEAEEEQQQEEEGVDLTPHEHGRAFKGAYRSFAIPSGSKKDTDSYFDQAKPHIKALIENQLQEMGPAKIIMTLWVIWKKRKNPLIELGPEDAKNAQDSDDGTTGVIYYTRIEM